MSVQGQDSVEAQFTRALVKGDRKTAESLLSVGLNPDSRDRFGRTLLIKTVSFGDNEITSLLLSFHADPNAPTKRASHPSEFPATPLQCAARTGNLQIAGLLIDAGAEVNATGGTQTARTPLSFAVLFNHLDMIRFLIEKGAEVNARDSEGASPLDYAAWRGSLDAVAILLAHGARLDEPAGQTGATPINEAAYRGHTALVQHLLQFHPNLELPDKKGYRPLENAIRMGKEDSALLLQPEAKLSDQAVMTAIKRDESRLIRELLRRNEGGGTTLASFGCRCFERFRQRHSRTTGERCECECPEQQWIHSPGRSVAKRLCIDSKAIAGPRRTGQPNKPWFRNHCSIRGSRIRKGRDRETASGARR